MVEMGRAVYLPVIDGAGEGFRARRGGVIPGSLHALPLVLYTCLPVLSQKTVLSLERLLSAAAGASRIIRILVGALLSLLLPQQIYRLFLFV